MTIAVDLGRKATKPTNQPFSACYFFDVVFPVVHTAYKYKPDFFAVMYLSRQVDSFVSHLCKTMNHNVFNQWRVVYRHLVYHSAVEYIVLVVQNCDNKFAFDENWGNTAHF